MIPQKVPMVRPPLPWEKLLISELWDQLESNPSDVRISLGIIAELDRRSDAFKHCPKDYTIWDAVKKRIPGSQS